MTTQLCSRLSSEEINFGNGLYGKRVLEVAATPALRYLRHGTAAAMAVAAADIAPKAFEKLVKEGGEHQDVEDDLQV